MRAIEKQVTDRPEVWGDYSHYLQAVGTMMIARIFGGAAPVPEGFGQFRPKAAP